MPRPRDILARFVSVTRDFETQPVVDELEKVDAANNEMADTASAASRSVEASFERMEAAARSSSTRVRTDVDQADSSLRSMGETAREEIPGAMLDMEGGVADAASGIGMALAPLGPAGIAVGAALAGFSLLKRRSDAAAEAMRESLNAALDAITVTAKSTNREIYRMYQATNDFDSVLEKVGDGDKTKGFEILADKAALMGVEVRDIVAYLRGDMTEGAQVVAMHMEGAAGSLKEQSHYWYNTGESLTEAESAAASLSSLATEINRERAQAIEYERENRALLRDQRREREAAADAAEREAAAAERIARAGGRSVGAAAGAAWSGRNRTP
jgi:hypothetical protein